MSDNEQKPMPTRMSEAEIEAAEQRCRAATDGPWIDGSYGKVWGDRVQSLNTGEVWRRMKVCDCTYHGGKDGDFTEQYANTAFIAHARTDLPNALATIRHLQSSLAEVRAERDALRDFAARAVTHFEVYGVHHHWCEARKQRLNEACNCGFKQAIAKLRDEQEALDAYGYSQQQPPSQEPEPEQQAGDAEQT